MNKSISVFVMFMILSIEASAQVRFGVKGGVTSYDFNPSSLSINDPTSIDKLKLKLKKARYGFTGGIFLDIIAGMFVVNPELSLSSMGMDYELSDIKISNFDSIRSETYNHLNMPILLGLNLGFLQIKGGPVGHYFLKSTSELLNFQGYRQNFEDFTWGFQGGIAIKIGSIMLDVRYEKNQNNFGSHINFYGNNVDFDSKNTRYIATIGFLF